MKYKILNIYDLTSWCHRHYKLQLSLENLMTVHRDNIKFSIVSFIRENLISAYPYKCKLIIIYDKELNKIIGIARSQLTDIIDGTKYYLISAVHVDKDYRGQKICQRMLTKLIHRYDSDKFTLNVYANNYPAIKCYEKVGFKIIDTVEKNSILTHIMEI